MSGYIVFCDGVVLMLQDEQQVSISVFGLFVLCVIIC